MSNSRKLWKMALACCVLAVASSASRAQEAGVQWRSDYIAARKESEVKNLPILIEFVTTGCAPCEQMDATTFRDPRIVTMLNEKYVSLRVNCRDENVLASRLGITRFPTMVLAGPDGRVAETLIGFKDADALNEQLQRVIVALTAPETTKREYENAVKWEANGEFARAITALRAILDDARGAVLQKDATELLKRIERRAQGRFTAAKALQEKGQQTEAIEALADLVRVYAGLQVSKDAADQIVRITQANEGASVTQRSKRARELLAQAHEFYKTKDYIPCLDRCELVLSGYGDLPEGQQAFALAAEIKNNPEWLQGAVDVMTDRLGSMWLALSDSHLKRGDTQKAQFYLQRILQAFPGSRLAESAQLRLTQIRAMTPAARPIESSAKP